MSNLDRPRDRQSRRHPRLPLARSPEPGEHACAGAEALEAAVLRTLLSRRREGAFVGARGDGLAARRDDCRQAPRARPYAYKAGGLRFRPLKSPAGAATSSPGRTRSLAAARRS